MNDQQNQNAKRLEHAPSPQRYQAAWAEVNTRIQSRLVIQGSFMTGVVVTLLLGLVPQGADMADPGNWRTAAVVLLPMLTFATALWVRHNDAIIGLLSAFMQHLEMLDDPDQTGAVPGWQDTRYRVIDAALQYRRYSDWAFMIVAVVATAPAVVLALYRLWGPFTLLSPLVPVYPVVGIGFGLAGMVIVFRNSTVRKKIKDDWAYGCEDDGKHRWHWRT